MPDPCSIVHRMRKDLPASLAVMFLKAPARFVVLAAGLLGVYLLQ